MSEKSYSDPIFYSHVADFTGYMGVVAQHFAAKPKGLKILDLPAGNGLLADALRGMGHAVTCGDINRERPNYRYVDMASPLPFADGEFDTVICLEGLEHLVNPVQLIAEFCRVTRGGGEIVISTPNVMNFYSRLQFLFTGAPYQFNPAMAPEVAPGAAADRGHVFPLSYFQLRYLFGQHGAAVKQALGDHYKRKSLFPLYILLLPLAWLWSALLLLCQGDARHGARNRELFKHSFSAPLLYSRSLVLILEKQ
ncbi:MAG: class I SAM-dependent methyltransferase [Betaproteobacteria bacterium]|nr:class I SAM-dependent methyltransferase [Betaproteobacteria bacterium]